MLALAASALSCGGDPTGVEPITELPRPLTVQEQDVIEASNGFAFGLLREMRAARPDSVNTFLSPLSASMALGMAMNGADGETWTQMRDVLGFEGMDEPAVNEAYQSLIALLVEFGLGNAMWFDDEVTLLPGFVDRVTTYFDAAAEVLDFDDPASGDVMNEWVADVTRGRIAKLLEEVDPDALVYLINAIYFNADWRTPFDEDRTGPAAFTLTDGAQVTVDMMREDVGHRVLNAGSRGAVQGVELPYGGGAYTAVALLPPESQPIDDFVAGIDQDRWDGWIDHFDAAAEAEDPESEGILVQLPKFEIEWGDSLNRPLQALGMENAFSYPPADFTRITDDRPDLYIYEVQQKTYVKVDEKGTEAAAATSVSIGPTSLPPSVTFDRPFVFAIRERLSGTILFLGVIGDPSR
jgi:serine protease inhibitor